MLKCLPFIPIESIQLVAIDFDYYTTDRFYSRWIFCYSLRNSNPLYGVIIGYQEYSKTLIPHNLIEVKGRDCYTPIVFVEYTIRVKVKEYHSCTGGDKTWDNYRITRNGQVCRITH